MAPAVKAKKARLVDATMFFCGEVTWPALFEPKHLLCRGSELIALSPHGFGAHIDDLQQDKALQAALVELFFMAQVNAKAFSLGLGALKSIAGGHWHKSLKLITKAGLDSCGRWLAVRLESSSSALEAQRKA